MKIGSVAKFAILIFIADELFELAIPFRIMEINWRFDISRIVDGI